MATPHSRQRARCHPDREHHAFGYCGSCYHRMWRDRPDLPPRPPHRRSTPLPRATFLAWLAAHGWTLYQVAEVLSYSHAGAQGWLNRDSAPPIVAEFVATHPAPRARGSYPPTNAGLRQWIHRHPMAARELAAFCKVSETAVSRWLLDRNPISAPIQAWLRAGAPPEWRWAPPGLPNVPRIRGKTVGEVSKERIPRTTRRGPFAWQRRLAAESKPRLTDAPPCVTCGGPTYAGARRLQECANCAARRYSRKERSG